MSAQDGTAPPVLFVVGTAGAGKSSLVTAFRDGQDSLKLMS